MKGMRLLTLVSLTALLLACGQKGPLVLPEKQKPKRVIPSTKPAVKPAPAKTAPAPADPAPAGTPPSAPATPSP